MNEIGETMKRANKLIIMLAVLLGLGFAFPAPAAAAAYPPDTPYQPPEQSREELNQDVLISLLLPAIQNEVDQYYTKYLVYPPMVAPYMVYILSAERIPNVLLPPKTSG